MTELSTVVNADAFVTFFVNCASLKCLFIIIIIIIIIIITRVSEWGLTAHQQSLGH